MEKEKFEFTVDGTKYVIWIWKGDYLSLGSGAEMGVYTESFDILGFKHWDVVDFIMPMTLNLYNYYGQNDIDTVFNWYPDEEQWWITGFNPDFMSPNANDMVMIGTIDFTGREEMFNALKVASVDNPRFNEYIIFDNDNSTIWVNWYKGVI